jgi:putative ABC transport system permease protein
MTQPPPSRCARWFASALLIIAPARLRRGYGPDMRATFLALYAGASARGPLAVLRLIGRELVEMGRARRAVPQARTVPADVRVPQATSAGWLDGAARDLRYALRTLRRDAAWTTAAVSIVAFGVGASATVFSVVHALLLRPLPFEDPARLVWIANGESENQSAQTIQVDNLLDFQRQSRAIVDAAAFSPFYGVGAIRLTGGGPPERVTAVPVTERFFRVLGVRPLAGRFFTAEECRWNATKAVVLAYGFWERRLGADPSIVGRAIVLDGVATTVVGVLPPSFDFAATFTPGSRADLFVPFPLAPETNRRGNTLAAIGRLASGADLAASQAEAAVIGRRLEAARAGSQRRNGFRPRLITLRDHVSGGFTTPLLVLAVSVGFLMLLVCANLSNLLLARAAQRAREMAVRTALGARRVVLVRQLLVESLVLSGAGAVFGLLLAVAGTTLLATLDAAAWPLHGARVDAAALAFTVAVAVATGLAFGLLPALRVSGGHPQRTLKDGGRGVLGPGRDITRRAIVVAEIALVCVLLTGAGLLLRSLVRVLDVPLGFEPRSLLAMRVDPPASYTSRARRSAYFDAIVRGAGSVPGVEAVGLTDALPLGNNTGWRRWDASATRERHERGGTAQPLVRMIDEGYLAAMRIPLHAGRAFASTDTVGSERVVVVNDALARILWPGADPVGRMLHTQGEGLRVVGVVGGVSYFALEREPEPEMYLPLRQIGDGHTVDLVVRGTQPEPVVANSMRAALQRVDPGLPVADVTTMDHLIDRAVFARRFVAWLIGGFAVFGLVIASLGLYALIAHSVAQRTHEMGIRLALGASPATLQRGVLSQTARLTLVGLAIGLPAAWTLGRAIRSLLFGVVPWDPVTFVAVAGALASVALLAGYLPARRASRIDPLQALRQD